MSVADKPDSPTDLADAQPLAALRLSVRTRQVVVAMLLLFGAQLWLVLGRGYWGQTLHLEFLAGSILLCLIPPLRRRLYAAILWLRDPAPGATRRITVGIFVVAVAYLVWTAFYQGRMLWPRWHDEFSYLLQMRMLAEGRLWMPAHPLADFFDTFYVITDRAYASMYFPGPSLLYVPAIWLGLPLWVPPVLVSGAVVALVYRLVRESLDGAAGLLAALLILAMPRFRMLSTMLMAQTPVLLMGLLVIWSYLRWREHRRWRWLLAMGAFAGWAAICRPVDAVCLVAPVALALLLDTRLLPWRSAARCVLLILLGSAPFLGLQLIANKGITGRWLQYPWSYYAQRDYPQTQYGFHEFDPAARPISPLPQKQLMYDQWMVPAIRAHRPQNVLDNWWTDRIPNALPLLLPPLVLILVPVGLLGVWGDRGRWVLWGSLPLFLALFSFYLLFLSHYPVIIAPPVALTVLAAVRVLEGTWPRWRAGIATAANLAVLALALASMPEIGRPEPDEIDSKARSSWTSLHQAMQRIDRRPAVVLFRFDHTDKTAKATEVEPVYNTDTAWPDDAAVIRAHDLGPGRNGEIYRYYAQREPQRAFYLYDRKDKSLQYLGTAAELARGVGEPR